MEARPASRLYFEPSSELKAELEVLARKNHMSTATFAKMLYKIGLNEYTKARNS